MPVLLEAFRDGLEAQDADYHRLLRLAHDEREAVNASPAAVPVAQLVFTNSGTDWPVNFVSDETTLEPTAPD